MRDVSENAAVEDRSAPVTRICTSLIRSRMGVSRVRACAEVHSCVDVPTTCDTYARVRSCACASAASSRGDVLPSAGRSTRPLASATDQRPSAQRRPSSATASEVPQFLACCTSTPLMVVSATSRCVCPMKITSIPGTSRAMADAAFSGGTPVASVS
jgi:hypothetical protein